MDRLRQAVLVGLNASAALAGIADPRYLLLLSIPVLAADFLLFRRAAKIPEERVAEIARSVEFEYKKRGSLFNALASGVSDTAGRFVNEQSRRLKLGARSLAKCGDQELDELFSIASFGAENGKAVGKDIAAFRERLDREIAERNRLRSKVGGMQTLSNMGMVLFLPLFGGVSAGILQTSLGVIGMSAATLSRGFTLLIEAYIFLMLYISTAFRQPGAGALENLSVVMPLLLAASNVMLFASTYIPNAI